ncbi:MAG: hypothetical protein LBU43_04775 [Candidatus Accumulibacter sp.]|jgi:hypothetical protein|nr:hypothetical protein [Accumulibacter sp.]
MTNNKPENIRERIWSCEWMKSKYLPLIIASAAYLFLYFSVKEMTGDEKTFFYPASQSMELFDFLKQRYESWTSRLLIEGAMIIILRLPFYIWKLSTGACLITIVWTVYYLFSTRKKAL